MASKKDTEAKKELDAKQSQPKEVRKRKKSTPIISIETYNKMFAAYLERQSASHVAKTVGVSERTAKRYIDDGHIKRGMAPLKDRLAKINDMTRQQVDYDQARSRAEFQKAARAWFVKASKRIHAMDPSELSADKLPENLNKVFTLIERTFGEAEHTHEMKNRFEKLTMEELREYLEQGIDTDN